MTNLKIRGAAGWEKVLRDIVAGKVTDTAKVKVTDTVYRRWS
jgi:hypothetical protein